MNVQIRRWGQGVCFYLFVSFFCILTALPSALFAGSVKGWGTMAVDSNAIIRSRFTAIAAGYEHSLAMKSDGSIVAWGQNNYGQATPPDGNDFLAIAAGEEHSLALRRSRVCQFNLAGDLNNDCEDDFYDFAILASTWLTDYYLDDLATLTGSWLVDCYIDPNNPACVPK